MQRKSVATDDTLEGGAAGTLLICAVSLGAYTRTAGTLLQFVNQCLCEWWGGEEGRQLAPRTKTERAAGAARTQIVVHSAAK